MSGLSVVALTASVNGSVKRPASKTPLPTKQLGGRKAMWHARRLAYAVGAVGVGVLGLSVTNAPKICPGGRAR